VSKQTPPPNALRAKWVEKEEEDFLFPSVLPCNIICNLLYSSCRIKRPKYIVFLVLMVLVNFGSVSILFSTSSFLILCVQLILCILLYSHNSKLCNDFTSFFLSVHALQPCNKMDHIQHLNVLSLICLDILTLHNIFRMPMKPDLVIFIRRLISFE
jgi:hypothetical protein